MKMRVEVIFFLVVAFAVFDESYSKTTFKNCGSTKVIDVVVDKCGPSGPCTLHKNTNATFQVSFTTNDASTKLKSVVHGIIAKVPVPFPLPNPDGCKNSGLKCPLLKGKEYVFTSSIPVKSAYPKVELVVKWELQNEKGSDVFCILIPVKIED